MGTFRHDRRGRRAFERTPQWLHPFPMLLAPRSDQHPRRHPGLHLGATCDELVRGACSSRRTLDAAAKAAHREITTPLGAAVMKCTTNAPRRYGPASDCARRGFDVSGLP